MIRKSNATSKLTNFSFDFKNLLPKDGFLYYLPEIFNAEESAILFETIRTETSWNQQSIKIYGRKVMQPRLTSWVADPEINIRYSGITMEPNPWTESLLKIKKISEEKTNQDFNGVLLNYYRDGQDTMGWHSDDEKELGENPIIVSISFGETRDFQIKHKEQKTLKLNLALEKGSMLIMGGKSQSCWSHAVPRRTRVKDARINLTFRHMKNR